MIRRDRPGCVGAVSSTLTAHSSPGDVNGTLTSVCWTSNDPSLCFS